MAGKRKFDDKATWRNDQWGIDQDQPARAEKIFDPADTVTDDPTAGGIGGGTSFSRSPVQMTGTMYTGLNDNPTAMVDQAYRLGDTLLGNTYASLTTDLTGDDNDLVFTANARGSGGNAITVEYVDPADTDQSLDVSVTDLAIVVSLATDSGGIITTVADDISAAIGLDTEANALVSVEDAASNDGSGLVTAMDETNLSGGSDAHYA